MQILVQSSEEAESVRDSKGGVEMPEIHTLSYKWRGQDMEERPHWKDGVGASDMHGSSVQEVTHPQTEMRRNLYLPSYSALKYSIKRDFLFNWKSFLKKFLKRIPKILDLLK